MAIDLTGIVSINEYYTQHYLNTILEEDIKEIINKFKENSEDSSENIPWSKLKQMSRKFYALNEKMGRERQISDRYTLQREFLGEFFDVLGYGFKNKTEFLPVKENKFIPVLYEVQKNNGSPLLWVIESIEQLNQEGELLHNTLTDIQYSSEIGLPREFNELNFEDIISKFIFSTEEPPRFIILSSYNEIMLIDRTKWGEKRVLDFKLDDIFSRKEDSTLQALVVLLHKSTLCPLEGASFLDTLSENSYKHANSVSEDLKYALRESIELLGNEAIRDMRERQRAGVFNRDIATSLTVECLRYMYRILFLLYIEARPELGYAPMESNEYLKGYSIESLRDLADKSRFDSEEARNGTYIDKTLKQLFKLIYNGFPVSSETNMLRNDSKNVYQKVFTMEPLKAHIFDPDRTQLLNKVQFRNETLMKIIKLMSISRPKGRNARPGRISYAQLGINQLGAVYEALLSYRGFLAEEDLYEVKKSGDSINELEVGYFVNERQLVDYTDEERVRDEDGNLKTYAKGTFIYRLAGREREKSASYYTPEVLTKSLVKYALKELLQGKTADEILELKVCEPAMGSAAFLNEAVNQLAEKYLELKQKELGVSISHDEYAVEKQKVKMYIADRNVYGIDLNPIAVELAEVSLWLNTIYAGSFVPWFGLQLVCGNSLVGARKQVYAKKLLSKSKKTSEHWYNESPIRVTPGELRTKNTIYHFLLSDPGMADYNDKVIKEFAKDKLDQIKKWKKKFIDGYTDDEIKQLLKLSNIIDKIWEKHIALRKELEEKTKDKLSIFGHNEGNEIIKPLSTREKDKILKEDYYSEGMMNAGPYARLKFAMDYWCTLWYWPIEKADLLPTRAEFLLELSLILEGNIIMVNGNSEQMALDFIVNNTPKQQMINLFADDLGQVDLEMLCKNIPRLQVVRDLANRYKFLHWELEFADIFQEKGGFDLILGNPPWKKVKWEENIVLGDFNPKIIVKKLSAPKIASLRNVLIDSEIRQNVYFSLFEESIGTSKFLNAIQNYPYLKGIQPDLYQCFLPQSWIIANENGSIGFVHPENIYTDPDAGYFRSKLYEKLRAHFQFQNAKLLFPIGHRKKYSLNIYSNKLTKKFITIANLFDPKTIDQCFENDNHSAVEGIKNESGEWNTVGHPDRIVNVTKEELKLFSSIYDEDGTNFNEARLAAIHTKQLLSAVKKFSNQEQNVENIDCYKYSSEMWHETNDVNNGIIKEDTRFPDNALELIIKGPHISNGTPLSKTPRRVCTEKAHYDVIDLEIIKNRIDYLPRSNYSSNLTLNKFMDEIPTIIMGNKYTDFYRLAFRKMLNIEGERTLISAIIPPGVSHINGIYSMYIEDSRRFLTLSALTSSIVYDFFIKITGKGNLLDNLAFRFPLPITKFDKLLILRTLKLNCLTQYYSQLWSENWDEDFLNDSWAKVDTRLDNKIFTNATNEWNSDSIFISNFQRRQALVEIDVLSAMVIGLTLDELKTIYRIQFPVLLSYENDTWYDRNGRIIFTNSKGLTGVGLKRAEWDQIKHLNVGTYDQKIVDDTIPGGPIERTIIYEAPFDRCDREKDYEVVWKSFEEKFKSK